MTDGANIHEFTVSELSAVLKRTVEDRFGHVRLRAELSGFKRAASGHLYFALKDDTAVMDGVCWRGTASRLSFRPEDGLEVIVTGKLTTYAARSKYQLVVDHMEPAGVGALMALLEDRRRKLAAEGLFDEAARKPLPYLPTVIGVVTSPTGAVIRDILHRLSDRFPRHVLVWPVRVQGDGAAEEIAAGIAGFNALGDGPQGASFGAPSSPSSETPSDISSGAPASPSSGDPSDASFGAPSGPSSETPSDISSGVPAGPSSGDPSGAPFGAATPAGAHHPALPRPDVLIVARGGGSVEDLWAFNEEIVVRAVAASAIPVISAVGHETDWTLIDHAADRRAPTPTGAAEMAVPVRADLAAAIADLGRRLDGQRRRLVDDRADRLAALARALPAPRDLMGLAAQRFDDLSDRLPRGLIAVARTQSARLNRLVGGLSPARLRDGVRYRRQRLDGADSRLAPAVRRRLDTLGDRLSASARMLDSLSFARVLDRGYALVMDDAGRPVTEAGALTPGQRVDVRFRDGTRPMTVDPADTGTAPDAPVPKRPVRKAAPKSAAPNGPNRDNKQGQLF